MSKAYMSLAWYLLAYLAGFSGAEEQEKARPESLEKQGFVSFVHITYNFYEHLEQIKS